MLNRNGPALAREPVLTAMRIGRTGSAVVMIAAVIVISGGCASTAPPRVDTESQAASAAGVDTAIVFRVEGGPIDEPGEQKSLSLSDAVEASIRVDPGIQAALARVRIALADAKQARLLPNPILNLAVRFPEGGGKPVIEASLAQDLISILMIPGKSEAADKRLRAASAAAVTTTIDVVAQVQEHYAAAQSSERLTPVLVERRAIVGRLLELAKARLAAGEGIREDVVVLEGQRVELEIAIAESQQESRDQRLQIARLIGRPSDAATWGLDEWQPNQLAGISESSWIHAALQSRPEVQEQAWQLAALGDVLGLSNLLAFEGASAGVQAQRDGEWQTGPEVSVPIPVFDGGQARSERIRGEQVEARHALVKTQRQVVEDVRRTLESYSHTQGNVKRMREELLPLQEQRRSLADAIFKAGQSDVTALYLAEQDLRASQAKVIELEYKADIAAIRLQRAVGGPGPERDLARKGGTQ